MALRLRRDAYDATGLEEESIIVALWNCVLWVGILFAVHECLFGKGFMRYCPDPEQSIM